MNSPRKKPGPKEADPGAVYSFAHQAYWGFRFLSKKKKTRWEKILNAKTVNEIRRVGKACSKPLAMTGAGYGAAGLMTWLDNANVARQVLAAKAHRRFPRSKRPSSQDRIMICLAIAVAAGVWELTYSTALRKLAEAGFGQKYFSQEVHRGDHWERAMKLGAYVWAEPIGNYFISSPDGKRILIRDLPCPVPPDFQGGFIIHGYGPNGFQSAYSKTLPVELAKDWVREDS